MKAFDKIIGYDTIKTELMQISDVLKNTEKYSRLGVTPPKGLFLYGEPGLGKTLMATTVIEASGRKYFTCRKDEPNGDFIRQIKETFEKAAAEAPSIVFLDDMDKFANVDSKHSDAEEYVTIQACIDEHKDKDVFVIATANDAGKLPDSLTRAGRFDHKIRVRAPEGKDAEAIIAYYMQSKGFAEGIDVGAIAGILHGSSCAVLETIINEAGVLAGYENADIITSDHLLKACLFRQRLLPIDAFSDATDADPDDSHNQLTRTACHEAGHIVVAEAVLPGSVKLAYVHRSGGCVTSSRENCTNDLEYYTTDILISLGGRTAVEHMYGIIQEGDAADLESASDSLKEMIQDGCLRGFVLGVPDSRAHFGCSEAQKERLELAVAVEMDRYMQYAKRIIARNHDLLDALTRALLEKRILTSADIRSVLKTCPIKPVDISWM